MKGYGITILDYDRLLESQEGLCALCKRLLRRPVVDHDHVTGRVRGIICHKCNVGIGQLEDSPELLMAAIIYLGSHGIPTVNPFSVPMVSGEAT